MAAVRASASLPSRYHACMTPPTIRPLEERDLDELVELCAEHAEYERATYSRTGKRERLARYLVGPSARAHCLVVDGPEGLGGYATWSREFSTWGACEYLHMDCLFLRPGWRGQGLGQRILEMLGETCAREGLDHLEWQTPAWNEGAIRFYRREGAVGTEKLRFEAPSG